MKKSLLLLFAFTFFYLFLQIQFASFFHHHPFLRTGFLLLYLWSPGIIALKMAHEEKMNLPVFVRLTREVWCIPLLTLGMCSVAFLCLMPLGSASNLQEILLKDSLGGLVKKLLIGLAGGYVLLTVVLILIAIGSELYFRGYAWNKLQKIYPPLHAVFLTGVLYSFWKVPLIFVNRLSILVFLVVAGGILVIHLILAPLAVYFRVKGKSILASAIFYGSLTSAVCYFIPFMPQHRMDLLVWYGLIVLAECILWSLVKKLYFPSTWRLL